MPFEGRNPQRGKANKRRMRRSKREDHCLATPHLMIRCRNMDDGGAKKLAADILRQLACATIKGGRQQRTIIEHPVLMLGRFLYDDVYR